jgi:DNA helicase-2/ATP-dependent DNA helicase PcrA
VSVEWDDLDEVQRTVADSVGPTVLVLGSAGTGKTTTALWAARREIERNDAAGRRPRGRVLFLTFSRTAVARVLERSSGVLTQGLEDSVEVMTFHGFGWWLARAFGRFHGLGEAPVLCSDAEARLLGIDGITRVGYDHLLPIALEMLQAPMIGPLLRSRWSLVVCDEFQDTSDRQWQLLELLGAHARLLLLADENQMIYQWIEDAGIGPHRIVEARARDGVQQHTLRPQSHRDPTQVLPDAARAFLQGNYDDPSIESAIASGRLQVVMPVASDQWPERVSEQIAELRSAGHRSIGIFVSRNDYVGNLCRTLRAQGVVHAPVGLGEARSTALAAQVAIVRTRLGLGDRAEVCRALAIFLTSLQRTRVPPGAQLLLEGRAATVGQQQLLDDLLTDVCSGDALDIVHASRLAAAAWNRLSFETLSGDVNWERAAKDLAPLVSLASRSDAHVQGDILSGLVEEARAARLVEMDNDEPSVVQVMTMHQTKGREADATIILGHEQDYFGDDWREHGPRLMYVALTRARSAAVVILPPDPHGLFAPLARWVR